MGDVMSSRKSLVEQEFALDRLHRRYKGILEACERGENVPMADRYMAETETPIIEARLRNVQRRLYGWREVAKIYGDNRYDEVERLKKEILELEALEAQYKGRISNYPAESKRAQQKVDSLKGQLGNRIGYNPTQEDLDKAHNELLRIGREAAVAKEDLPRVQKKLDEIRKQLDALEKSAGAQVKSHNEKTHYASPGDEVDQRARAYAEERKISYADAVALVIDEDPALARAYLET